MNFWETALGLLLGSGATFLFFYFRKPPAPQIIKDEEEITQLKQKLAEVPAAFEPIQKKLKEALEKKESYKKLVEIHAQQIEQLKQEKQKLVEEGLTKGRRVAELELYLEDPAVISHPDKELEFLYKQLKQHYEEQSKTLEELRVQLFETENRATLLQKQAEEVGALEEEKRKLEELVTKLSVKKPSKPKSAATKKS